MSNFQSVIIDCNPSNWCSIISDGKDAYKEIIQSIIAFSNSRLFSSLNNRLLVIAAGGMKQVTAKFEYEQNEGTNFTKQIENFLYDMLTRQNNSFENPSNLPYSAAISLSICAFRRFKKQFPNSSGNILIINLAEILSNEQSVLMNLFFASRQYFLRINVVSLKGVVPILQQACDITCGLHVTVRDMKLLGQSILGNCHNFSDGQNAIFDKPLDDIDYRAVCHCHNRLVSIGWVCSICLSITCNFVPFCKICNAIFSRPTTKSIKA